MKLIFQIHLRWVLWWEVLVEWIHQTLWKSLDIRHQNLEREAPPLENPRRKTLRNVCYTSEDSLGPDKGQGEDEKWKRKKN